MTEPVAAARRCTPPATGACRHRLRGWRSARGEGWQAEGDGGIIPPRCQRICGRPKGPIHRMFPGCPRSGKIGHAEGGVLEGVGVAVYEKDDLLWLRKFLARGRMECRVPQADDQCCRAT